MSNLLFASELGKRPQVARLIEPHTAGSGIFTCEALSGWAGECSFVVYEVDSSGSPISGSETDWIGTKNNRNLENLELTAGVDRDYPTDRTYLVATETAGGRNKLIQGLKNTLNDDGTLKNGVVDFSKIPDGSVTTPKIANNAINNDKIADNSLDGKKILDNSIQLSKLSGVYSSTKAVEIGTWIDGRKIYRKVYSGKGNVPLEVTVDRCATVIDMRMVVKNKANNGSWRTVPWLYDTADNSWVAGFYLDSLRSVVVMQLKENMRNAYWWHFVIDYCIEAEQG
jgi:hypothetical protein|nr:MAG TPA: hypothetical protein [Caudoviricetes sp.]